MELFHNILNYRFAQNKGIAENILEHEERLEQHEKATGEKVQENLKVSTLIQGMKPEVKRHLLLNLDEKTKYTALRQYLVNYESAERWTNSLAQQGTPHRTTTDLIDKGEDHGGMAAMDINQAWYKGKGKGYKGYVYKGKGKGKGKGKNKGKDCGKGFGFEGKGKGKEKGFGKGRGRGNWKGREVEASEVTKAEVQEEEKVFAGSKEKVKARHKQLQEFANIAIRMDNLKDSVDTSNAT